MAFLSRNWNGRTIRQREDGYLSLTDMAQSCGKLFGDWYRLKSTEEYLQAFESIMGIPIMVAIESEVGGSAQSTGTWANPKIALRFAQWLSPKFAVHVDIWVEELLLTGKVELTQVQPTFDQKLQWQSNQVEQQKMLMAIAQITGDNRALITVQSSLQNALIPSGHSHEVKQELLSVTEVCELHGISLPKGKDSVVGRKVAKTWRNEHDGDEPQICAKHVGSGHHTADIKVYPQEFFEQIISIAEEYL